MKSGNMQIVNEVFNLRDLVNGAVNLYSSKLRPDCSIDVEIDDQCSPCLIGDQVRNYSSVYQSTEQCGQVLLMKGLFTSRLNSVKPTDKIK